MHDMNLVTVGIAQVGTEIVGAIVWARTRRPFIRAALLQPTGIGILDGLGRRSQERHHTAIGGGAGTAVERPIGVEAGQVHAWYMPAS